MKGMGRVVTRALRGCFLFFCSGVCVLVSLLYLALFDGSEKRKDFEIPSPGQQNLGACSRPPRRQEGLRGPEP